MQIQCAVGLATVQEDRYTSNRNVRHDQRRNHDLPSRRAGNAVGKKVEDEIQA